MDERDVAYYRQRVITESRMAFEAGRSDVAAVHEELAKQYQALVDRRESRDSLKGMTARTVRKLYDIVERREYLRLCDSGGCPALQSGKWL